MSDPSLLTLTLITGLGEHLSGFSPVKVLFLPWLV